MTELVVGMPAPDFCLPDADEQMVCLSEHRGRFVVVYFYPRDNTSGCTLEARSFTEELDAFTDANAVVLGISPDSPKSHKRFAEKQSLAVTLLSDPDHMVSDAYGVWVLKKMYGRESMGILRSTFLLDPEGKIAHIWRKVKVKGHVDEVMAKLLELRS
ncbi:MAG: thioredoxin-dependent thiol peroxidase [Methanocalculus sp. MSAO_Arc1]|uniref:thioredoxin-dependent thiol peroxidase n=1 Tax=Methanocalculus TaxID=71151 RepID=UPI000FF0A083|nr:MULTISPECIES: thioredoxin-dependent thiol peroxidase [unclassified Methanocalculus]MCP1662524.1 peroxiredoxin Q/BCP [Methanocalculus sp. AMF5]RQD81270.1 MAG: thioredoxin-dependent thiol peroxidase [Methanocalculus sp. MSAO_Arc1]